MDDWVDDESLVFVGSLGLDEELSPEMSPFSCSAFCQRKLLKVFLRMPNMVIHKSNFVSTDTHILTTLWTLATSRQTAVLKMN